MAFVADKCEDVTVFDDVLAIAENGETDSVYTSSLENITKKLINYLRDNPEVFGDTTVDSRDYTSSTFDEIAEAAPKYEFDPDLSGDLELYIENDCISWDDVSDFLDGLADVYGGTVNQWALDAFTIEDLDREQVKEWERSFYRDIMNWLDELENEYPNYGEEEE